MTTALDEPTRDDLRAEYQSLREEIARRSAVQQALFALNVTAISGLVVLASKGGNPVDVGAKLPSQTFYALALIPFLSFSLARLWLDHHTAIAGIGGYISRHLEARVGFSWEWSLRRRGFGWTGRSTFFLAYAVVFAVPSVFAVAVLHRALAHNGTREAMWWAGITLTVCNFAGWLDACYSIGPAVRRSLRRPPKPVVAEDVTVDELRATFHVRTLLDWDAVGTQVRRIEADHHSDFSNWYFPWYRDRALNWKDHDDQHAYPVPLGDAASLSGKRGEELDETAAWLAIAPQPLELAALTYPLGGGRQLVLDGNHRLGAAIRRGYPFRLIAYELAEAPPDPRVLPDLRHWQE